MDITRSDGEGHYHHCALRSGIAKGLIVDGDTAIEIARLIRLNAMFDVLICDCDGVIVDSECVAERVLGSLLRSAYPGHDVSAILAREVGQTTSALLKAVARLTGEPIAPSFVASLDDEVYRALRREASVVKGVREALQQIPLPVAIASNSRYDWVEVAVARAGLTAKIDAIFSADSVARPKPAPDLYLFAAQELGVMPARCLVVEDSVSGVTAARAAGMSVLGFVGASHIFPGHADCLRTLGVLDIVEQMDHLPAAVAKACAYGTKTRDEDELF